MSLRKSKWLGCLEKFKYNYIQEPDQYRQLSFSLFLHYAPVC